MDKTALLKTALKNRKLDQDKNVLPPKKGKKKAPKKKTGKMPFWEKTKRGA